ncbi:MAG: hypothetical protein ACOCZK_00685 [Planctomycetota bacterium]
MGGPPRWLGPLLVVVVAAAAVVAYRATRQPAPGPAVGPVATSAPVVTAYAERTGAGFATGLEQVHGFAIAPDGRVAVAGADGVALFAADGTAVGRLADGATAYAVAWGPGDEVLAVAGRDRLRLFSPDGSELQAWSPPRERVFLTGVAVGPESLYVADDGNHPHGVIWRLDHALRLRGSFGERDGTYRGLKVSSTDPRHFLDLAVDPRNGQVLVANMGRFTIERFSPDGSLLHAFGTAAGRDPQADPAAFVGCCNPIAIAVAADGSVFTSEKGVGYARVKRLSEVGEFRGFVAAAEDFAGAKIGAVDVACLADGRVAVLDYDRRRVRYFERKET